jgi:hypothetical protein
MIKIKHVFLLGILFCFDFSVTAQQLQLNAPDPLPDGTRCDIQSSPGISGDHYYVLYTDQPKKHNKSHTVISHLKIYSIRTGTLSKSVNLNALVSEQGKNQEIAFAHVQLWTGKLATVYMSWSSTASWLNLYAQLLDEAGNKQGNPTLLETLSPSTGEKDRPAKLNLINAENTGDLARELHVSFTDDSSHLLLYYTGTVWKSFAPVLLDNRLQRIKKWTPGLAQNEQILQCATTGEDLIALIKTLPENKDSANTYRLTTLRNNTRGGFAHSIPVSLPGKIVQDARFRLSKSEEITVSGTYALADQKNSLQSTQGVFALVVNRQGLVQHSDIHPFPGGMISDLASYKAAVRGKGLDKIIHVNQVIPLGGGDMVTVGRSFTQRAEATSTPVVLLPHYDISGHVVLTGIDARGKVQWISYLNRMYEDYPSTTSPASFFATRDNQDHLLVVYDENGERRTDQQIFVDRYGDQGIRDRDWMALPRSFNTRSTWILWNTASRTPENTIMVAYYNTWKKEMGTLKIHLSPASKITMR